MKYVVSFVRFWYDFVVGDDWTVAAGVVVALALTGLLVRVNATAWWLVPLAVILMLAISLWNAVNHSN